MSESLRGRRSEEMTQLNTSSPQGLEVLQGFRDPEKGRRFKVGLLDTNKANGMKRNKV